MVTYNLLRLPVVYYDYAYSLLSVPPIVFYTQLLYYAYLIFIITTFVLLILHYLLSLPMLLSGLLMHNVYLVWYIHDHAYLQLLSLLSL